MVRSVVKRSSFAIPFATIKRVVKKEVLAPFYHLISPSPPPHVKHLYHVISPQHFATDLDFMLRHFTPISASDMGTPMHRTKQHAKPPLFLSFDDGFKEIITHVAPILLSKGVPATFFVCPNFIDNKDMLFRCKVSLLVDRILTLGWPQKMTKLPKELRSIGAKSSRDLLKALSNPNEFSTEGISLLANRLEVDFKHYLSDSSPYMSTSDLLHLAKQGFTIGAHSLSHPNFSNISLKEQVYEAEESLLWIKNLLPEQTLLFSFPFTAHGVTKDFFNYFSNPKPLMFGTSGFKPTNIDFLLNRIPMELEGQTAKQVIKGELLYYLAKKLVGKHVDIL